MALNNGSSRLCMSYINFPLPPSVSHLYRTAPCPFSPGRVGTARRGSVVRQLDAFFPPRLRLPDRFFTPCCCSANWNTAKCKPLGLLLLFSQRSQLNLRVIVASRASSTLMLAIYAPGCRLPIDWELRAKWESGLEALFQLDRTGPRCGTPRAEPVPAGNSLEPPATR